MKRHIIKSMREYTTNDFFLKKGGKGRLMYRITSGSQIVGNSAGNN